MSDLLALADRIAAATEPSLLLDYAILKVLRPLKSPQKYSLSDQTHFAEPLAYVMRGVACKGTVQIPPYTSSLDAITETIRERSPKAYIETHQNEYEGVPRSFARVDLKGWIYPSTIFNAGRKDAHLALALCEALIRAMAGEGK